MPLDNSIESYEKNIIQVPIKENKYLNYIFRKFGVGLINRPDSKYTFIDNAYEILGTLNVPDAIYSRSYPLSSTILAYKLACRFKVPWILHLSDPWSWSPIHDYSEKDQLWHTEMEKKSFEKATYITLTSEGTRERYTSLYPEFKGKFRVTPNVYDPLVQDLIPNAERPSKLKFAYTGGLSGDRTLQPFVEVLNDLNSKSAEMIEFKVAGDVDRKNRDILKQCSMIKYVGQLNFSEAIALQSDAHVLVVVDNPISNADDAVFLPSKLLDYMILDKEIWALTTKGSATESFLRKIGKSRIFYHHEKDRLEEAFKSITIDGLLKESRNVDESYSAEVNAKMLAELINTL